MSEEPDPARADVDGRGWRAHGTWPPPPEDAPAPSHRPSSPRRPVPPRSFSGTRIVVAAAFVAILVIAGLGVLVSTGTDVGETPPPAFAASDTARPVAFDPLFVAPLAGFAPGPTVDVLPSELAGHAGSSRASVLAAVVHDGYVAGARRVSVSRDAHADVTVTILQMASAVGARAFAPVALRPYLDERGWAFGAPVPDGIGAVGLQQVIADSSGRYALVAVAPAKRYVVMVAVRSPDQQALVAPLVEAMRAQWAALAG